MKIILSFLILLFPLYCYSQDNSDTLIYNYIKYEKYFVNWATNYLRIEYLQDPNEISLKDEGESETIEFRIINNEELKKIFDAKKKIPCDYKRVYEPDLIIREGISTEVEIGSDYREYKNGLKHGKELWMDKSFVGGIRSITNYENGIYKSLISYYPNGFIWQDIKYDPIDIKDKIPKSYYITEYYMEKKDQKKSEGKMINSIQEGKWLYYDINGRVEEKEYKNGVEVSK